MVSKPLIVSLLCVGAVTAADMLWKRAPSENEVQSSSDTQAVSKSDVSRLAVEKQFTVSGNGLDNPLAHANLGEFDIISKRVLFSPLRKQLVAAPSIVQVPVVQEVIQAVPLLPAPDPGDFTLVGVVATNQSRIALLRWNETQETLRLRSGDTYAGWKIAEIKDRNVSIGQQGKLFTLKLFKSQGDPAAIAAQD